jgi:hypothetical protein
MSSTLGAAVVGTGFGVLTHVRALDATDHDMWHSTGMDLVPYTRLYTVMRERILGHDVPADPAAGSFVDGVANQAVVDAIRASSATRAWAEVPW